MSGAGGHTRLSALPPHAWPRSGGEGRGRRGPAGAGDESCGTGAPVGKPAAAARQPLLLLLLLPRSSPLFPFALGVLLASLLPPLLTPSPVVFAVPGCCCRFLLFAPPMLCASLAFLSRSAPLEVLVCRAPSAETALWGGKRNFTPRSGTEKAGGHKAGETPGPRRRARDVLPPSSASPDPVAGGGERAPGAGRAGAGPRARHPGPGPAVDRGGARGGGRAGEMPPSSARARHRGGGDGERSFGPGVRAVLARKSVLREFEEAARVFEGLSAAGRVQARSRFAADRVPGHRFCVLGSGAALGVLKSGFLNGWHRRAKPGSGTVLEASLTSLTLVYTSSRFNLRYQRTEAANFNYAMASHINEFPLLCASTEDAIWARISDACYQGMGCFVPMPQSVLKKRKVDDFDIYGVRRSK